MPEHVSKLPVPSTLWANTRHCSQTSDLLVLSLMYRIKTSNQHQPLCCFVVYVTKIVRLVQLLQMTEATGNGGPATSADRFHLRYNIPSFSCHSRRVEMKERKRGELTLLWYHLNLVASAQTKNVSCRLKSDFHSCWQTKQASLSHPKLATKQTRRCLHILRSEQCNQLFYLPSSHHFITLFIERSSLFERQHCGCLLLTSLRLNTCESSEETDAESSSALRTWL